MCLGVDGVKLGFVDEIGTYRNILKKEFPGTAI